MTSRAPSERTRLRRVHDRGAHDRETIDAILDAGLVCHVGYTVDGAPHVTPTLYWREGDRVYWHGSSASAMLRGSVGGAEVCLTVTHLDGFVMARSGFHHSVNFRSVMIFGSPEKVEDPGEKLARMEVMVERLFPGRWADLRPVTDQELKATSVLSMPIEEASAKVRAGGPVDDEEDYALPIWAGVVPLSMSLGAPEPCPRLADATPVPADLSHFVPGR